MALFSGQILIKPFVSQLLEDSYLRNKISKMNDFVCLIAKEASDGIFGFHELS